MVHYSPQLDKKVLDRLDNAIAICDTEFILHPGFPEFTTRYFTRPLNNFLMIISAVEEDLQTAAEFFPEASERVAHARALIKSLIDTEHCEINAAYAERSLSVHGQIMRTVDGLRTNHRICVLTNCSRTIESISRLRKDKRKEARGISCLRMSSQTNKPMVAQWHDPDSYAAKMVGCRTTNDTESSNSSTGTPSLKSAKDNIREVVLTYRTTGEKALHINQKDKLSAFVRSLLTDNIREHSIALYLDVKQRVVNYMLLSIGVSRQVYMCPKMVFKGALAVGADAVVLIHNHPSGAKTPSKADIDVAKYFKEFEKIVNIPVLEHLILTEEGLHPYFKNGSMT
jgi:hypothetical protein